MWMRQEPGDFMLEIMLVSIPGGVISKQCNRIQSYSPQVHFIDRQQCFPYRAEGWVPFTPSKTVNGQSSRESDLPGVVSYPLRLTTVFARRGSTQITEASPKDRPFLANIVATSKSNRCPFQMLLQRRTWTFLLFLFCGHQKSFWGWVFLESWLRMRFSNLKPFSF